MVKYLESDLQFYSDSYRYLVFPKPGSTIISLSKYIKELDLFCLCQPVNVILHVGTNSLANCGLLTKFLREYNALIRIVKSQFPRAQIFISSILVREDFDVRAYNHSLSGLCDIEHFIFINNCDIALHHLSFDGLHLNSQGYIYLCNGFYHVTRPRQQRITGAYTKCMQPPLQPCAPKKKKKDCKKAPVTTSPSPVMTTSPSPVMTTSPSPVLTTPQVKKKRRWRRPKRKPRKLFRTIDGYMQVGFTGIVKEQTSPRVDLPPAGLPKVTATAPPSSSPVCTVCSPSRPSPYIQRKMSGKAKKKKIKRIKKRRNRKKRQRVSILNL